MLTLITKYTEKGRLSKPAKNDDIDFLEKALIIKCLERNKSLINIKDTRLIKEMVVPGFINNPQGAKPKEVKQFVELIGS